ncbi:proline-rich protein 3-like [Tripterygium wilfordii]|uniref:Proline-rich protein 3-like n=2 Tax=Tripterygium wilfordii TaxID=458696 RepID=A0A7J7CB66_TRIWF|nr:proline-rich protein 3-like [Tripterygium wilfordii]
MAGLSYFFFLLSILVIASAADYSYAKPEMENILSSTIGIQGIIYCKSGHEIIPLEGAVARITCSGVDEYGFDMEPFTVLADATDAKGYFFATLSPSEVEEENKKLKECKAFLELSPSNTCTVPTDVNGGITGALLASHRFLNEKKIKLYTIGPFFYTPGPNNGY